MLGGSHVGAGPVGRYSIAEVIGEDGMADVDLLCILELQFRRYTLKIITDNLGLGQVVYGVTVIVGMLIAIDQGGSGIGAFENARHECVQ